MPSRVFGNPLSQEHHEYLMTRHTVEPENEREAREMTSDSRGRRSTTSTPGPRRDTQAALARQASLVERRRRDGSLSQALPSYLDPERTSRKRRAESQAVTESIETVDMTNGDDGNDPFQFKFEAPGHPNNTAKSNGTFKVPPIPSRPSTNSRRRPSHSEIMDNERTPLRSDFTTPQRQMSVGSNADTLFVDDTPSRKSRRIDYTGNQKSVTPRSSLSRAPSTFSERPSSAFGSQGRPQRQGPRTSTFTPIRDTDSSTITLGDLKLLFNDLTAAKQGHENAESTLLEVPKQFLNFKQEICDGLKAAKQEMRDELRGQQEHMDKSFQALAKRAEKAVKDCWECATAAHTRINLLAIATGQQKPVAGGPYGGTAMDMEEPTRFFAGILEAQQSAQPPAP